MAVLAVSVFLTSCEQKEIIDVATEQQVEYRNEGIMIMPFGIATDTEEVKEEYMKNARPELLDKMVENGRVAYYLLSIDKHEEAIAQMSYGDFFSDLNFTSFLAETQIVELQNYEVNITENSLESRCDWAPTGNCESRWINGFWNWCCQYKRERSFWFDEYKWECS